MDRAKDAISGFLHHNNKHDVTTEQTINAPVHHEHLQETRKEELTTAVDREVHESHYQTHVQPIVDKEVAPETHHHNIVPVEHREKHHGKDAEIEATLAQQAQEFQHTKEVLPTQETRADLGVIGGEHHHHHIHDVVQPVIEKEIVQPHVVHTVVPIHERIEKEPTIHSHSVEPTITLDEFTSRGGTLDGAKTRTERYEYEGDPMNIDSSSSKVGFGGAHRHHGDGDGDGSNLRNKGASAVPNALGEGRGDGVGSDGVGDGRGGRLTGSDGVGRDDDLGNTREGFTGSGTGTNTTSSKAL